MTLIECYNLLEISPDSSLDDVKKAYKRKAFIHHPDRNSGRTDNFHRVKDAYNRIIRNVDNNIIWDVLSDLVNECVYSLNITSEFTNKYVKMCGKRIRIPEFDGRIKVLRTTNSVIVLNKVDQDLSDVQLGKINEGDVYLILDCGEESYLIHGNTLLINNQIYTFHRMNSRFGIVGKKITNDMIEFVNVLLGVGYKGCGSVGGEELNWDAQNALAKCKGVWLGKLLNIKDIHYLKLEGCLWPVKVGESQLTILPGKYACNPPYKRMGFIPLKGQYILFFNWGFHNEHNSENILLDALKKYRGGYRILGFIAK